MTENYRDFEIEKLHDAFYVIRKTKACNIGVCIRDGAALALDSGRLPGASAALIRMLHQDMSSQVELLFNTHHHADHTFGNQSFHCPIMSTKACRDTMREILSTYWAPSEIEQAKVEEPELADEWKDLVITVPTAIFEGETTYDFHGLKVIFQQVDGHTDGSAVAYFPEFKLLFAGDLVFGDMYPTLLFDGDPYHLVEALRNIMTMDVEVVVPGHGAICDKSTVKKSIDYWNCLISECRDFIDSGIENEKIVELLVSICQLDGVELSERRHKRNIGSVLNFIRRNFS